MGTYRKVIFGIALAWAISGPCSAFAGSTMHYAHENGILENIQVSLLVVTSLLLLTQLKGTNKGFKLIVLGGFLLCISFIMREVDIESFAAPAWQVVLVNGVGRNIILTTCWMALGVSIAYAFPIFIQAFKTIIFSRTGVLLITSALLLFIGGVFEEFKTASNNERLYEEVCELMAYCALLAASITLRFCARRSSRPPSQRVNAVFDSPHWRTSQTNRRSLPHARTPHGRRQISL